MAEPRLQVRSALLDGAEIEGLWAPAGVYLNTASYGLPPRPAVEAVERVLAEWQGGRSPWETWTQEVGVARERFARLVGCRPEEVATGATVSEFTGLVAASLPDGARVVVPEVEFTSNLFPWLVHAERLDVATVPLEELVDAIDARTTLVAVSAVQSSNGQLADLAAIAEACRAHDARLFVDATQACGWLPLADHDYDFLVAHSYKWLLSPRGATFFVVRNERLDELKPLHASWWAGDDPYGAYYGPPLRLAENARRFDTSPAWFSWVGAAPALETLERIGIGRIHAHNVELANRFRNGLELEPGNSAIVSVDVENGAEKLERAGIRGAVRAGGLRVSFHVYNTADDVDAALDALR
jgi:selenocysteine lyase/cysteine desulfurase